MKLAIRMLMGFSLIASVAAIVPPASRAQHYAYVNDEMCIRDRPGGTPKAKK